MPEVEADQQLKCYKRASFFTRDFYKRPVREMAGSFPEIKNPGYLWQPGLFLRVLIYEILLKIVFVFVTFVELFVFVVQFQLSSLDKSMLYNTALHIEDISFAYDQVCIFTFFYGSGI